MRTVKLLGSENKLEATVLNIFNISVLFLCFFFINFLLEINILHLEISVTKVGAFIFTF